MRPQQIGLTALLALLATLSPPVAITFSQPQVLAQVSSARKVEADRLLQQGNKQLDTSKFKAALESFQHNIGVVYDHLSQYPQALEFYQQALMQRSRNWRSCRRRRNSE